MNNTLPAVSPEDDPEPCETCQGKGLVWNCVDMLRMVRWRCERNTIAEASRERLVCIIAMLTSAPGAGRPAPT